MTSKIPDSVHTILSSAKRFLTGTAFSRVTGLLRDMAMAAAFGTQESVAAFLVAFRFSHLLRRLFGEGALQSAFIPEFEKLRNEDPHRAFLFFQNLSVTLTIFLCAIIFLVVGGIGLSLAFLDLQWENREILQLTLIMMPSLLFICLYGINASLLQCEKCYLTPSIAPAAFNLAWIAGVGCLYFLPAATAMPWLSCFVIVACICQWGVTLPKTVSLLKEEGLLKFGKLSFGLSKDVKTLIKPLCLGIAGVAASQINNAMDSVFARYASLEGPAYLWYAIRIQQLPLALFGIALSGAILPPLARAVKEENLSTFRYYIEFGLKQILILMVPATFGIFLAGEGVVHLLYGHGDFGSSSVSRTYECLWAYGLGLVPMAGTLILAPAFYALKNYRIPAWGSFNSVIINILLNGWLIFGMGYGAVSVALATSFSAFFNLFFLIWNLKKIVPLFKTDAVVNSFYKICGASASAFLAAKAVNGFWPSPWLQGVIFTGCYLLACWILKVEELKLFLGKLQFKKNH